MFNLAGPSEIEGVVDVLIMGAGPAGMTAAVYAARKRRQIGIVTKDIGGQVAWTLGIENYMGYQFITGRELTAKFEEQVRQFSIPIVVDEVKGIKVGKDIFESTTAGGRTIESKSIIVASGKRPKELGLPGEQRFVGRGLSYCATCDGPLFSGKGVAVIGGGNSAVQAAIEMGSVASRVFIVSRNPWRADPVIADKADLARNLERRIGFEVTEILGNTRVEGLRIREKATGQEEILDVNGVFVEIGLSPNTDFVKGILKLNDRGEVVVNCRCETNVPGIFAAGDVTDVQEKQIVVAAGEGAKAALSAHEYLMLKP
ncbi:MAG TPA: FAD-dependent oxidoreductase [Thermoplasmata archaeon]